MQIRKDSYLNQNYQNTGTSVCAVFSFKQFSILSLVIYCIFIPADLFQKFFQAFKVANKKPEGYTI
jgi:hypothetical protein